MDSSDLIKMRDDLVDEIADNHNEVYEQHLMDSDDVINSDKEYLLLTTKNMEQEIDDMFDIIRLEQEVGSTEWEHGLYFIHEDDFTDFCKELCTDIGEIPNDFPDYIVIDWEATAENLRAGYSVIEYQGDTYYYMD